MGRVADLESSRRITALVKSELNKSFRELYLLIQLVSRKARLMENEYDRAMRLTNIAIKRYILRDQPVPTDILAQLAQLGVLINELEKEN